MNLARIRCQKLFPSLKLANTIQLAVEIYRSSPFYCLLTILLSVTEEFPILIMKFQILQLQFAQIIGCPMSYRNYANNNYYNPQGSSKIVIEEEFDFQAISAQIEEIQQKKSNQSSKNKSDSCRLVPETNDRTIRKEDNVSVNNNNKKKPQQQQKNAVAVENEYFPIALLSTKFQKPFRGRLVKLDEIRTFGGKNGKKEGKLFSIHVLDEDSLVVATFFDQGAEKFHDVLEEGKVYKFSGGQVKPSRMIDFNKQIGAINFDVQFDTNAVIEELDDDGDIGQNKFNFVALDQVKTMQKDQTLDVIGIVKSSQQAIEFQPKNKDTKLLRRMLIIYDNTMNEIEVVLYGSLCTKFPYEVGQIYQFKTLKVSEFSNQRNLSSSFMSSIHRDDYSMESMKLLKWMQSLKEGELSQLQKQSEGPSTMNLKSVQQIVEESVKCESDSNLKVYSEVRAHLILVKSSGTVFYGSCTNCMRKVQLEGNQYFCQQCNIWMDQPRYRFILSCKIADHTGNIWVTVSDLLAQQIVDVSAQQIKEYVDQGMEKEKQDALNQNVYKEFKFRIVSKLEEFNEQKRVKYQVSGITNDSLVQDTQKMLNQIQFYMENC